MIGMVDAGIGMSFNAVSSASFSSSYRVKFKKKQFLQLVELAHPQIIYHVNRIFFFNYDGFVLYTFDCEEQDFSQIVIDAIEFSNTPWNEKDSMLF